MLTLSQADSMLQSPATALPHVFESNLRNLCLPACSGEKQGLWCVGAVYMLVTRSSLDAGVPSCKLSLAGLQCFTSLTLSNWVQLYVAAPLVRAR